MAIKVPLVAVGGSRNMEFVFQYSITATVVAAYVLGALNASGYRGWPPLGWSLAAGLCWPVCLIGAWLQRLVK